MTSNGIGKKKEIICWSDTDVDVFRTNIRDNICLLTLMYTDDITLFIDMLLACVYENLCIVSSSFFYIGLCLV